MRVGISPKPWQGAVIVSSTRGEIIIRDATGEPVAYMVMRGEDANANAKAILDGVNSSATAERDAAKPSAAAEAKP